MLGGASSAMGVAEWRFFGNADWTQVGSGVIMLRPDGGDALDSIDALLVRTPHCFLGRRARFARRFDKCGDLDSNVEAQ